MHWFNPDKVDNKIFCCIFTEIYSKLTPIICVIQGADKEENIFKLNL